MIFFTKDDGSQLLPDNDFVSVHSAGWDGSSESDGSEGDRPQHGVNNDSWHCMLPNYRKTVIRDPCLLFRVFASLQPTRQAHWDFIRWQWLLSGGNKVHTYDWQRKKLILELPPTDQFGIVRERQGQHKKFEYRQVTYPQKRFPRRKYEDLYRETITSLKDLLQYWIDLHNDDVREKLMAQKEKGMLFS